MHGKGHRHAPTVRGWFVNSLTPGRHNVATSTRGGSGIQKGGGGSYIQKGGGGVVQEFQERIQIVAGSWANQQAKKIADSRRGGGSDHPKKTPVSAHEYQG